MRAALDELGRALAPGSLLDSDDARLARARDCWPQALGWGPQELRGHMPLAVVLPRAEEEAAACLEWAQRRGVPVVPRGGGSGVLGAAVPGPDAVVLDLSRLDAVLEWPEAGAPRVTVGGGALGGALEDALNGRGWSLMHFPQSMKDASAAGWLACDGYGQLSTRYGGVGRQATRVRAVLPGGAALDEDAAVHLGAEGALGVLTRVTVGARPLPAGRSFHARAFPSMGEAMAFARAATAPAAVPPSVLRLYSPVDAFFNGLARSSAGHSGPWRWRLEAALLRMAPWLHALAPLAGRRWLAVAVYEDEEPWGPGAPPAGGEPLGEGPARRWWDRRFQLDRERLERVFASGCFADTADLWAPWDGLELLERDAVEAIRPHAFAFAHLSHPGPEGACLYVTFAGSGGPEVHGRAWSAVMEAGRAHGGCVNHHHGVGLAKRGWLTSAKEAAWLEALRARRRERDPKGILNPGKPC